MNRYRLTTVALLATLTIGSQGCTRGMAQFAFGALVVTAAVVTVMAIHDAHMHSAHCGHQYVIVEDHPVYSYGGHWEYYDEDTGRWYRYREPPPEARVVERQEYYVY